jgi:hypothetical protein
MTTPGVALSLRERIEAVEQAYELMLAYAAQGRAREENDPMGIRQALRHADAALDVIEAATPKAVGAPDGPLSEATANMLAVLRQDAARARAAFRFVVAQPFIGSQLIDNVNASIHVRALLTDLFLLDEALSASDPS